MTPPMSFYSCALVNHGRKIGRMEASRLVPEGLWLSGWSFSQALTVDGLGDCQGSAHFTGLGEHRLARYLVEFFQQEELWMEF